MDGGELVDESLQMRDVDRVDCGGLDVTKHLLVVLDVLQNVARTHSSFLQ